jgi:threonylcarbamoyladenosine tRNA methylthiotransferase MtaB
VLVERDGLGRTEHFTPAEIAGAPPGVVVAARITGNTPHMLLAEAA